MDGPWHIDIRCWAGWADRGPGVWSIQQGSQYLGGGRMYVNQGTRTRVGWDVPLVAGTWRLTLTFEGWSGNEPAARVLLDSTIVGTVSMTAGAFNSRVVLAGIVVPTDGLYRVRIDNEINVGYMQFQHLALDRTA